MPSLGLVLAWGGYWFLAYGLALRKNANVTLIDMALPSHRQTAVDALRQAWGSQPTRAAGSPKSSGRTLPLIPEVPGFGPKIGIPGTNVRVQP